MSGTPRLRSAFPATPRTEPRFSSQFSNSTPRRSFSPRKSAIVPRAPPTANTPFIPFDVIDAPTQRLYVVAFYAALCAWRLYESWVLSDDLDSTWLFLKWVAIDFVFLGGLPSLRIPWLEWSFSVTLAIFILHVVMEAFLMFRIPIPIGSWIAVLLKLVYDREIAVSERSVNPNHILHNSSLILGKQIIQILPEGSAMLNPDHTSFCLDASKPSALLPIRVNQTTPISIELIRYDLETGQNEKITISAKQAKAMKKHADKGLPKNDVASPRDLLYKVTKTGIYRLSKVMDESKLEVQRRTSDTLVVSCPRASIGKAPSHKCKGDLSDLMLEVEGTPPLKIKYSRKINGNDDGFSFQSIQPEGLVSPLMKQQGSGPLIDPRNVDMSWARPQIVRVPLNESLGSSGTWSYSIEEVHDACGNVVTYSPLDDATMKNGPQQGREFTVLERPRISMQGCNQQKYLQVAKHKTMPLPLNLVAPNSDAPYSLQYTFTPHGTGKEGSEKALESFKEAILNAESQRFEISEPGWYSLTSISGAHCSGDILEPASCLLHNPPEPELAIRSERIFDKCANNPIGFTVDLDLIGTPPFRIQYSVENGKSKPVIKTETVNGLRGQMSLVPTEAGHYRYKFLKISDSVYHDARPVQEVVLEQDVRPPASARFATPINQNTCFGEAVQVGVDLLGEAPWTLAYELVHNGKRTKHELKTDSDYASISTENLMDGGKYTLALTSVTDQSGCKRLLKDEMKINVRPDRPKAAFGLLERKREILALEDSKVNLPVRLSGVGPWQIKYRNLNDSSQAVKDKTLGTENSLLNIREEGIYEIISVQDHMCPGTVDSSANIFGVSWIPRPKIIALDGQSVEGTSDYYKQAVCEGDEDSLAVKFSGSPPFTVKYEQQRKAAGASSSSKSKEMTAGLGLATLEMDTSKPGDYTYKFVKLGDNLYDHNARKHVPLTAHQKVNPKPSARFEAAGHTFGLCKDQGDDDESIPLILEGQAPFSLEVHVKHHSNAKPQVITIPHIATNKHNLQIPRRLLGMGHHTVSVRKILDARGCQRTMDVDAPSVKVHVSDVASIAELEAQQDYCVGERISFALSGQAPFDVFYTFGGVQRKATSPSTIFRRIAETAGDFEITAVQDSSSGRCKSKQSIVKHIHEMPSVKISHGRTEVIDIHEGGDAELLFEFSGTPPFEFTYIRSSNAKRGKKSQVLETKHDVSYEYSKTVRASDEGTYEVVAIRDAHCSFSTQKGAGKGNSGKSTAGRLMDSAAQGLLKGNAE